IIIPGKTGPGPRCRTLPQRKSLFPVGLRFGQRSAQCVQVVYRNEPSFRRAGCKKFLNPGVGSGNERQATGGGFKENARQSILERREHENVTGTIQFRQLRVRPTCFEMKSRERRSEKVLRL